MSEPSAATAHRPVLAALGAALAAVLAGCGGGETDSRGLDYLPDMYESTAYRSQQAQVVTDKDGKVHHYPAMLTAPEGTVARDFVGYQLEPTDFAGAKLLLNPQAPSVQGFRTGQQAYRIYCAVCHGNDGNSTNGYVSLQFTGIPSLNAPNLGLLSDGEMYHIITHGRARMPNYRAQLLPETRWAVVNYVRALNRATLAVSDAAAALKIAEDEVKAKPDDLTARAALDAAKVVSANAKRDIELIRQGGEGREFSPPPAAVPEYVKPTWPEE